MRDAIFLAHRIPYPPDKGDKIRSWRLFEHLAKSFRVHLGCFVDNHDDWAHTEFLEGMCASAQFVPLEPKFARIKSLQGLVTGDPLTFRYYRSQVLRRWVENMRDAYSPAVEIAFSSSMAPYLEGAAAPVVLDFVDADSDKWRQYAQAVRGPMRWVYAREARRLASAEARWAARASASFCVTADEADVINAHEEADGAPVDWWANGVDAEYFNPYTDFAPLGDAPEVVFTGAMDYRANVDAVTWFLDAVWPKVRAEAPAARFAIVGARPAPALVRRDGRDGVVVTGRVADVRPWIAGARVAVAPLRIARGVQNKVLEAMAMASAVIASPEAARGVSAEPGRELAVAETPEAFAAATLEFLNSPDRRAAFGAAARARILADYVWAQQLARFDAGLARIGAGLVPGAQAAQADALTPS